MERICSLVWLLVYIEAFSMDIAYEVFGHEII